MYVFVGTVSDLQSVVRTQGGRIVWRIQPVNHGDEPAIVSVDDDGRIWSRPDFYGSMLELGHIE